MVLGRCSNLTNLFQSVVLVIIHVLSTPRVCIDGYAVGPADICIVGTSAFLVLRTYLTSSRMSAAQQAQIAASLFRNLFLHEYHVVNWNTGGPLAWE